MKSNPSPSDARAARSASQRSGDDVCVRVQVAAPVESVWKFLSDGPRFAQWIGAFAGQAALPGTRIDPRQGGTVRVEYPGGHAAVGEIVEFVPPSRIAFTWGYEAAAHGIEPGSTRVEVSLTPHQDGTRVELRHSGLPTEEARSGHRGGWTHYLSMLAREASASHHGERIGPVLAAYFQAWAERDPEVRRRLLETACDPEVRVRSGFACTDSVAELSEHIANAQQHMPDMTMQLAGPPRVVHGHVMVRWSVLDPRGQVVFGGADFGELSAGGRLRCLVSFSGD